MNRITCDIWLYIDTDGNYAVGTDEESAQDNYRGEVGDPDGLMSLIHLTADCPLPRPIVGRLVVPEVPDQAVLVSFDPH